MPIQPPSKGTLYIVSAPSGAGKTSLVRALLDRLDRLKRPVVVGCNSWAWQYLVRAGQADAILPTPIIFKPFDAKRLKHWLGQIAEHDGPGSVAFRDAESGDDIMAEDEDGKPAPLFKVRFLVGELDGDVEDLDIRPDVQRCRN